MINEFKSFLGSGLWSVESRALQSLVNRAENVTAQELEAAFSAFSEATSRKPALSMVGDVAVIGMSGPITYRETWMSMFFGGASIESMQNQFRMALADEDVKAIVFRCDTPGGTVEMVPEFADEIFAARGVKPIVAVADTMICSAGIWLAAQADQIWVSSSSLVGSIGVFMEHEDLSGMLEQAGVKITTISYGEHKTDGSQWLPLADEAQKGFQADVNQMGREFDGAMARGRGVSTKVVADTFGQGKVFRGRAVISAGLADKFGTAAVMMKRVTKVRAAGPGLALEAAVTTPVPAAASVLATIPKCTTCATGCDCPGAACNPGCETCGAECPCFITELQADNSESDAEAEALATGARQADVDLTESTLALMSSIV